MIPTMILVKSQTFKTIDKIKICYLIYRFHNLLLNEFQDELVMFIRNILVSDLKKLKIRLVYDYFLQKPQT